MAAPERRERSFGKGARPVDAAGGTQPNHGGQAGCLMDSCIWHQAQTPQVTGSVHL
jgi:hypothetical protein